MKWLACLFLKNIFWGTAILSSGQMRNLLDRQGRDRKNRYLKAPSVDSHRCVQVHWLRNSPMRSPTSAREQTNSWLGAPDRLETVTFCFGVLLRLLRLLTSFSCQLHCSRILQLQSPSGDWEQAEGDLGTVGPVLSCHQLQCFMILRRFLPHVQCGKPCHPWKKSMRKVSWAEIPDFWTILFAMKRWYS